MRLRQLFTDRAVNGLLLLTIIVLTLTGIVSLFANAAYTALLFEAHRIGGAALLILLIPKAGIVARSLRKRRPQRTVTARLGIGLSLLLLALTLGACTLSPLETPTPSASDSPSPPLSAPPTTERTPSPTPAPSPTPRAAIPDFDAGEIVTSTIDGLRVRSLPGVERPVVTGLLPLAFELRVVMGPIAVDDLGWYLVVDADEREPNFEEGWVAAGSEPDPLLGSTGRVIERSPYVASMEQTGNAEEGPIEIGEGDHAIRWIALDPERVRCSFAVSFTKAGGGGDPLPAIRATIGTGIDRGTLQPQSFAALGIGGPVFATVTSDCAWALVIVRVPPDPSPSPTP